MDTEKWWWWPQSITAWQQVDAIAAFGVILATLVVHLIYSLQNMLVLAIVLPCIYVFQPVSVAAPRALRVLSFVLATLPLVGTLYVLTSHCCPPHTPVWKCVGNNPDSWPTLVLWWMLWPNLVTMAGTRYGGRLGSVNTPHTAKETEAATSAEQTAEESHPMIIDYESPLAPPAPVRRRRGRKTTDHDIASPEADEHKSMAPTQRKSIARTPRKDVQGKRRTKPKVATTPSPL